MWYYFISLQVNMWKIIYLICREIYENMIGHHSCMHNLSNCEIKLEKKSDLNGIWTRDLCDTDTVLYQLSSQAKWELVTLWVHIIQAIDGEEYKWIYERLYIWTAEKDMKNFFQA